jgi:hypothetical protein
MENIETTTNPAIKQKSNYTCAPYIREDLMVKIKLYRLQYPGTIKNVKQFANDAVDTALKEYEKKIKE